MQDKICWNYKNFVRLEKPLEVGERVVLEICRSKMEVYYIGKAICDDFVVNKTYDDYLIFRNR